jgi:hypothetical protein
MDLFTALILVAIGIAAGLIASIVGGVANIVSIMPGTMLAALSDRSQLPKFNRDFIQLNIASIAGAAVGAMLLFLTPVSPASSLAGLCTSWWSGWARF